MLTRSCAVSLPLATKIWLVRSTQLDGLAAEIVVLVYVIELKKKLWVSMCIIVACVGLKKLRLSRWRNLKISLKIFSFNKLDFILKVEVYFSGWLGSNHGIYFWVPTFIFCFAAVYEYVSIIVSMILSSALSAGVCFSKLICRYLIRNYLFTMFEFLRTHFGCQFWFLVSQCIIFFFFIGRFYFSFALNSYCDTFFLCGNMF